MKARIDWDVALQGSELVAAVREVLASAVLDTTDLIGVLEDLAPGGDTMDVTTPASAWSPQVRTISRSGVEIAFGDGDRGDSCAFRIRLSTYRTPPLWPASAAENERLAMIVRGEL